MSENVKTVQEELELRRENKQDIHEWIREQSGRQTSKDTESGFLEQDIHEWIKTQNQTKQIGEKTNE